MACAKTRPWGNIKPSVGSQVNWSDPINNGLSLIYLLNEKAGLKVYDLAGHNDGIVNSGPTWSAGIGGSALLFNGGSSACQSSVNTRISGSNPRTISGWFQKTTSNATDMSVVRMGDAAGIASGFELLIKDTNMICHVYGGNTATLNHNGMGNWSFFAMTGGASPYTLWNGKSSASVATTLNTTASSIFLSGPPLYYLHAAFVGKVDNVRLHRRVLSSSEIHRLANEPFAGITSPRLRMRSGPTTGGSFKAAWANNRNSILGAVVR